MDKENKIHPLRTKILEYSRQKQLMVAGNKRCVQHGHCRHKFLMSEKFSKNTQNRTDGPPHINE